MTTLPLADARARLSSLVESASTTHERYDITRNGRRAAVLLGAEDFDALQETLEVLADRELLEAHRRGDEATAAGDFVDGDELSAMMKAAGRA